MKVCVMLTGIHPVDKNAFRDRGDRGIFRDNESQHIRAGDECHDLFIVDL